jgi:hypothetical protein
MGVEFMGVCIADCVNDANVAATFVATRPGSVVGFACGKLHAVNMLISKSDGPSGGWLSLIRKKLLDLRDGSLHYSLWNKILHSIHISLALQHSNIIELFQSE